MISSDKRPAIGSILFLTGAYLFTVLLFLGVWVQSPPCKDCFFNFYTNVFTSTIPLLGSVLGFLRFRHFRQPLLHPQRLAPTLFFTGLFMWSMGGVVWSYYNFVLKTEVPYPSLADVGYFSHTVLWTVGIFTLYWISDTNPLQEIANTPLTLMTLAVGAIVWIMLSVRGGVLDLSGNIIKFLLDVGYPMLGTFNFALLVAFVFGPSVSVRKCSRNVQIAIYGICVGVFANFVTDFVFNFTTSLPASNPLAYYNGNFTDFMYQYLRQVDEKTEPRSKID